MTSLLQSLAQGAHVLGHDVLAQRLSGPGLDQGPEVVLALHLHRDHGGGDPRFDVVVDTLVVAKDLAPIAHGGVAIALAPQVVLDLLRPRFEGVGTSRAVAHQARHLRTPAARQVDPVHADAHERPRGHLELEVELAGPRGVGFPRPHPGPPVAGGDQALPHPLRSTLGLEASIGVPMGRAHELGETHLVRDARDVREAEVNTRAGVHGEHEVGPRGPRRDRGSDLGLQISLGHEALDRASDCGLHPRRPERLARSEAGEAPQAVGSNPPVPFDPHPGQARSEPRPEDEGDSGLGPVRFDHHVLEVAGGEQPQDRLAHVLGVVGITGGQAQDRRIARGQGRGELHRAQPLDRVGGQGGEQEGDERHPSATSAGARRSRSPRGRSG